MENNLPKVKDGACVINLDECESIGTHWITCMKDNVTQFDSFGVEYILKEIKKFISKQNIANIEYEQMVQ